MIIYEATKIVTMDESIPLATHVAVKNGKIIAVGGNELLTQFPQAKLERRFCQDVMVPGFVEGHAHIMAGAMWQYAYCGYHDRIDPAGKHWQGLLTSRAVVDRLHTIAAVNQNEPIIGWGYDPIFMNDGGLTRALLDEISPTQPIAVIYSNFHAMCVNSTALDLVGYHADLDVDGLVVNEDGELTGELREVAAMFPILRRLKVDFASLCSTPEAIDNFGEVGRRAGVTTMADLFSSATDADIELLLSITSKPTFPIRLYVALGALGASPQQIAQRSIDITTKETNKLKLSAVKLMTDGSIQAYTARIRGAPYANGIENGIWNTPPEQIHALCDTLHASGIKMHIHVNGDEAAEVSIDALEAVMKAHPTITLPHVLQHCQMMDRGLYQRCAELGIAVNIFANHIWYFGDQHITHTIGQQRAENMDACATALQTGVRMAIHSDAPVTPLNPLFSMWCAVNRQTMSNQVLGKNEVITPHQALHAVTLGAAYTLDMDGVIGSIAVGKYADFTLLDHSPVDVEPSRIKDISVKGTVLGGQVMA